MASNFTFGLVIISEVNEILVLLAQTINFFFLYPIIFELDVSKTGIIGKIKQGSAAFSLTPPLPEMVFTPVIFMPPPW